MKNSKNKKSFKSLKDLLYAVKIIFSASPMAIPMMAIQRRKIR